MGFDDAPIDLMVERKCNCRNKDLCPLDGACLTSNVIYEATVTTTTGNTKTATPTIKSTGVSSRGQVLTEATFPATTCVCLRKSASCPLAIFPSSTRNLSWSLNVVMRTSSSQQPIRTGAVPTVLKFEIPSLSLKLSHINTQSGDRLVCETRVTITFYLYICNCEIINKDKKNDSLQLVLQT